MHFVFITGGVASSLGKGIASASIASLLQSRNIGSAIIYESNLINPDIIYLGQNKNYDYEKFFLEEDIKYIFENANCEVVFFYNKSK